MHKIYILILFLSLTITSLCQVKVYKLLDSASSSDINYKAFPSLHDATPGIELVDHIFKVVKGKYKIYRFLATYTGISGMSDEEREFHDLVIVKTNKLNKVIDAYMYNLDFADPPNLNALYRSTARNIFVKDNMLIEKFKFTRPHYFDSEDTVLKENSILSFIKYSKISRLEKNI